MITSRQNDLVKKLRSLKDKKFRDIYGEYTVEGVKSVKEAVASGAKVTLIATVPEFSESFNELGVKIEVLSNDVFKSVSEEVSPQGVIAVVEKPIVNIDAVTEKCLFLDGVSDPSNVGAIIRSAAAFGYNTVLIADGADAFSSKAVRASMGGIFRVKVIFGDRTSLINKVKVPFVVADMGGTALNNVAVNKEHCLVIGNEAHGVSNELRLVANTVVAIPMQNGMESLNAAVSCGIIMYSLNYVK